MAVERRQQATLKVEIPKDESPKLGRVGIIAIVGFAIGAIWPTLAKVKLVPSAPTQAAATPGLGGEPVPRGSAAAVPEPAPPPSAAPVPVVTGPLVGELQVTSCRDSRDRRVEVCDGIEFDAIARPRLAGLGECEGARQVRGALSLGFELDLKKNVIERIASGKSTTLRQPETDSLVDCAKKLFAEVKLDSLAHQHEKYTAFYKLEFQPGEDDGEAEGNAPEVAVTPASGKATVSWDVALVRSAPSKDGKVVARILSGTRVIVSGRNGEWYEIKYDAKGSQGWVYRTAIGM